MGSDTMKVDVSPVDEVLYATSTLPKTRWQKIQEVIWDGPRSKEERRLIQRLDLFIM